MERNEQVRSEKKNPAFKADFFVFLKKVNLVGSSSYKYWISHKEKAKNLVLYLNQ